MRWGLTRTMTLQPCSSSVALTWPDRAPPEGWLCGLGLSGESLSLVLVINDIKLIMSLRLSNLS